jgi:nucleoside-diphosphate-sugar epimerase
VRERGPATVAYRQHVGDLRRPATLAGLCEGADTVVHAAALVSDWDREEEFRRVNRDGTAAVVEDALRHGVRRLVYVSTADVFGFRSDVTIDERSPKRVPDWPYSLTKTDGERLCRAAERAGLEVVVVYPTWIFGPGDRHFVPEVVDGMETGQLVYFARGRTHLELTYSENLADAIALVSEAPGAAGESYIVGDDYGVTFGDFIRLLAATAELRPPRFSVPFRVAYWLGGAWELWARATRSGKRPLLTRYAVSSAATGMRYDTRKLRALGWAPRVGLEEAMRRTVASLGGAPDAAAEMEGRWLLESSAAPY